MKVTGFKGTGIFGYLNFNIDFNEDVSFLVGGNGSGKTTALKLMNALVMPNLPALMQIPFDKVSLQLTDAEAIEISATVSDEKITVEMSGVEAKLILPNYSTDDEYFSRRRSKYDELVEEETRRQRL